MAPRKKTNNVRFADQHHNAAGDGPSGATANTCDERIDECNFEARGCIFSIYGGGGAEFSHSAKP